MAIAITNIIALVLILWWASRNDLLHGCPRDIHRLPWDDPA